MTQPKSVRTDRVWLRDDFDDALDKLDEEQKLGAFLHSTPNGSAIGQYLRHERKELRETCEPEYRFFYDASSQKADYVAVWLRMEKYPTGISPTMRIEARTEDQRFCRVLQRGYRPEFRAAGSV